jgi:hypothetical protein
LWFWWWFLFVFVFLLLPLGYGWGYRGWGPPYSRRSTRPLDPVEAEQIRQEAAMEERAEQETWGWLALAFWFLFTIAFVWLLVALIAAA